VQDRPRLAVTGIELLSPGNKQPGAVARERSLEKRASALCGGLHWVEIDLRGGERPPIPAPVPEPATYRVGQVLRERGLRKKQRRGGEKR
jgi:hypothetical protein